MSMLNRKHNFRLAYRSLKAARGRSMLTMLGIIIGVMAVILVVCIGEGVKQQIAGQLNHYGKQAFIVRPVSAGSGSFAGLEGFGGTSLSVNDLSIVQKTSGVQYAVPLATATGSMSGDNTVKTPFIVATDADFPQIVKQQIQYGGFFDGGSNDDTVVLGSDIAHKLFNDNAPLGQALTWRGRHFIVAGVFNDFAAPPFSLEANFNDAVFVPYATAQSLSRDTLGIYEILAMAQPGSKTQTVIDRTQARLTAAHGGSQDVLATATVDGGVPTQTLQLLTDLVYGAAVIALVVGGIGIMNVMLVSVTERMHEIGLRKAIGATNRQIMRQFMAEALLLSGIGAITGVVLSCGAVGLLRLFTSLQPVLVWQILLIAPVVAVIVGMFFGSIPALKAARKDPIEALRHE